MVSFVLFFLLPVAPLSLARRRLQHFETKLNENTPNHTKQSHPKAMQEKASQAALSPNPAQTIRTSAACFAPGVLFAKALAVIAVRVQ